MLNGKGPTLLGRKTAEKLELLTLNFNVNAVNEDHFDCSKVVDKFPQLFEGIGKLKNFQVKLYLDDKIKPVIQGERKIYFHLKDKVKEKIRELEENDIAEPECRITVSSSGFL